MNSLRPLTRSLVASGRDGWKALGPKPVHVDTFMAHKCGNILTREIPDRPVVHASTVIIHDCDKNFVYYWLRPVIFPTVKTIYLGSHPCEWPVLQRFPEATIYMSTRFQREARWGVYNLQMIPEQTYKEHVKALFPDIEV